jgi:protein dithiol oxidoreductase (disulfide-forming)
MLRAIRLATAGLLLAIAGLAQSATWVEGKHYFLIEPRQMTTAQPGKIEVTEAFSYGCPACNQFAPIADQLKASLPATAQMVYLPASFNPSEDWPMFQRSFYAAQALGIVDRTHNAMFDAIWKTGELAILDSSKQRLKNPLPTIEDAAKFYARVGGVKAETFIATAKSFGVETNMRRADMLMKAYKVPSTPTIVINGRYRTDASAAGGYSQLLELVKYLVDREAAAAR